MSEARLRSIVNNSTEGLVLVDDEGRVQWASPAAGEILGYEPDAAVGTQVLDFVHPDDIDAALPSLLRVVEGRSIGEPVQVRVRRADGHWRWVEALAKRFESGPSGSRRPPSSASATSPTGHRRARPPGERARFRTVVATATTGRRGRRRRGHQVGDPQLVRLLGWTPEEVEGMDGLDLVHPDDRDCLAVELAEYVAGEGVPLPDVVKMRHKDGSWRHIEIVGTDFLRHPGIEGIALNLRGVAERIAAEAERQRLIDIFEATEDLVGICDDHGALLYMNAAAKRLFGIGRRRRRRSQPLAGGPPPTASGGSTTEVWDPPGARGQLERRARWSSRRRGARPGARPDADPSRRPRARARYFSAILHDISERKAFELRLAHQATHDPLTGLPNRTLLLDRLERRAGPGPAPQTGGSPCCSSTSTTSRSSTTASATALGDRLLVAIAERLHGGAAARRHRRPLRRRRVRRALRGPRRPARRHRHRRAGRRRPSSGPFVIDDTEVFVGVSIGIALPDDGEADPETLIRDADAAMYRAKDRGRARWELFDNAMRASAVDRLDIENALRRALDRRELRVYYQPIVDLDDRRASRRRGAAALGAPRAGPAAARRVHRRRRGDRAHRADRRVGARPGLPAGAALAARRARDSRRCGWRSTCRAASSATPSWSTTSAAVLADTGIDPTPVELEITESVLMDDVEMSADTLGRLHALGVKLAVDDFGTGYSSLSYLRRFPVDVLKVDRSFVDGLGTDPATRPSSPPSSPWPTPSASSAVAEGVETAEQLGRARGAGLRQRPGLPLAKPMPAADLAAGLAAHLSP